MGIKYIEYPEGEDNHLYEGYFIEGKFKIGVHIYDDGNSLRLSFMQDMKFITLDCEWLDKNSVK